MKLSSLALALPAALVAALPAYSHAESTADRTQLVLRAVATPRAEAGDAIDYAVVSGVDSSFVRVRCATGYDASGEEKMARFTIVGARTYLLSKPVSLTSCRKRLAVLLASYGEAPFVLTLGKPVANGSLFTAVGLDAEATRKLGGK